MPLRQGWLVSLVLGLGAAGAARADGGVFLDYGQSAHVWSVYNQVKDAQGNLFQINDILNANFGTYDTAFTRLGGGFDLARPEKPWARAVHFELAVEAAALGLVQNPVVPELVAAATAVTTGRISVPASPGDGWTFEPAFLLGWGLERRLSAVSTDLIQSIPFQKDNVTLWGADLAAGKEWQKVDDRIGLRAAWEGTAYHGLSSQTSVALDRQLRSFTQWWEGRADYSRGDWNLHGIAGSHPLPVRVLPRVWDRVANTNAWRELGAMSGAGITWKHPIGRSGAFSFTGGFYAGYVGGAVRAAWSAHSYLELASFGIENSSAYHTLGQRVYNLASVVSL